MRSATYSKRKAEALGLAAGYALDAVLGDPRRLHPVAGFGRFARVVERNTYKDSRLAGAAFAAICVGVPLALAKTPSRGALARAARSAVSSRFLLTAGVTWAVLGGRSLRREGALMERALSTGDITAARNRLPHLCGRDPSNLDEKGLARATIESIAENTSDAEVAPLFWGAVAGLPGLIGYRAINTLDAMVGHKSPRYARFGTASARLDDLANLIPSRLTALLTVAVSGTPRRVLTAWRAFGHQHPSPNSGQCESAFAGALDVRLGGTNVYAGRVEHRPTLGTGPTPSASHIKQAVRISALVGAAAVGLAIASRGALALTARSAVGRRWT